MLKRTQVFFIFISSNLLIQCITARSKYNQDGEDNPYEFGFTIDGQQHRHEMKDVNGIIQGEFGFITADGIYHVTVYATDENGNFKILSMRNVRVSGPLDGPNAQLPDTSQFSKDVPKMSAPLVNPSQIGSPVRPAPPGLSALPPPSAPLALPPPAQISTPRPNQFTTQATIKPACAGCGYVTNRPGLQNNQFQFQTDAFNKMKSPTTNQNLGGGNAGNKSPSTLNVPFNSQGGFPDNLPNIPGANPNKNNFATGTSPFSGHIGDQGSFPGGGSKNPNAIGSLNGTQHYNTQINLQGALPSTTPAFRNMQSTFFEKMSPIQDNLPATNLQYGYQENVQEPQGNIDNSQVAFTKSPILHIPVSSTGQTRIDTINKFPTASTGHTLLGPVQKPSLPTLHNAIHNVPFSVQTHHDTIPNIPITGKIHHDTSHSVSTTGQIYQSTSHNLPITGQIYPDTIINLPSAGQHSISQNLPTSGQIHSDSNNKLPSTGQIHNFTSHETGQIINFPSIGQIHHDRQKNIPTTGQLYHTINQNLPTSGQIHLDAKNNVPSTIQIHHATSHNLPTPGQINNLPSSGQTYNMPDHNLRITGQIHHDSITNVPSSGQMLHTGQMHDTIKNVPTTGQIHHHTINSVPLPGQINPDKILSTGQINQDILHNLPPSGNTHLDNIPSIGQRYHETIHNLPSTGQSPQNSIHNVPSAGQTHHDNVHNLPSIEKTDNDTFKKTGLSSSQKMPIDTLRTSTNGPLSLHAMIQKTSSIHPGQTHQGTNIKPSSPFQVEVAKIQPINSRINLDTSQKSVTLSAEQKYHGASENATYSSPTYNQFSTPNILVTTARAPAIYQKTLIPNTQITQTSDYINGFEHTTHISYNNENNNDNFPINTNFNQSPNIRTSQAEGLKPETISEKTFAAYNRNHERKNQATPPAIIKSLIGNINANAAKVNVGNQQNINTGNGNVLGPATTNAYKNNNYNTMHTIDNINQGNIANRYNDPNDNIQLHPDTGLIYHLPSLAQHDETKKYNQDNSHTNQAFNNYNIPAGHTEIPLVHHHKLENLGNTQSFLHAPNNILNSGQSLKVTSQPNLPQFESITSKPGSLTFTSQPKLTQFQTITSKPGSLTITGQPKPSQFQAATSQPVFSKASGSHTFDNSKNKSQTRLSSATPTNQADHHYGFESDSGQFSKSIESSHQLPQNAANFKKLQKSDSSSNEPHGSNDKFSNNEISVSTSNNFFGTQSTVSRHGNNGQYSGNVQNMQLSTQTKLTDVDQLVSTVKPNHFVGNLQPSTSRSDANVNKFQGVTLTPSDYQASTSKPIVFNVETSISPNIKPIANINLPNPTNSNNRQTIASNAFNHEQRITSNANAFSADITSRFNLESSQTNPTNSPKTNKGFSSGKFPPTHSQTSTKDPADAYVNPQSPTSVTDPPPYGITVTKDMINVPNNPPIPIQSKYPNMVDGLPNGISKDDITGILYKFNYTVGFHGHYEKGYKSGAKVGGYFVTDRDGVSRIVTYVADENGYRPKVKFIRLDLNSDLVPKEGTEKTFGLKSFEFVWYPIH